MLRSYIALCAAFVCTGATAQVHSQSPSPHGTKLHRERDARDLQALQAAKIPLAQAVNTTEAKSQGRAVSAAFEVLEDTPQYEIKTLGADGKLIEHHVEANSGQILGSDNQPVESLFNRLKPADLSALKTMTQAVEAAEQKAGGKAAGAQVTQVGGGIRYTVNVIAGDLSKTVTVGTDGNPELLPD